MLKTKEYIKFTNFKPISLEGLYDGNQIVLSNLRDNIFNIINVEAPITLNTLKSRLRETLNVKKISQKALDIINDCLDELEVCKTDNFYDVVFWPKKGIFDLDELRINFNRQIYDIPYQELGLLARDLNLVGEELYRAILNYFGYEVLTEKARKYLEFIEKMSL